MRYFIQLSYKGCNYHGWQIQNNANTIQAELNKALSNILEEEILCTGCGRTDTGVHAKGYFAHFDCKNDLISDQKLIYKINGFLPQDIVAHKLLKVKNDANSRFDAVSRTYHYQIFQHKDAFSYDYALYYYGQLNIKKMNDAAKLLLDYSDFTSFSKAKTQTKTNNCNIIKSFWEEKDSTLNFYITANRFLRGMVRSLVGTMIDLGRGKISIDEFREIILSKNRENAGFSAPAKGLFLIDITYPESIFYKN